MKNKAARELLVKYKEGTCTDAERAQVEAWYASWNEGMPQLSEQSLQHAEERIYARLPKAPVKTFRLYPRIAAAAAILIFVSTGIYFILYKGTHPLRLAHSYKNDIPPGTSSAFLTLDDGRQMVLNSGRNGLIASQGGTAVKRTATGAITYTAAEPIIGQQPSKLLYNTLTLPAGAGKTSLNLPDGTIVWLNAGSSLKFPVAFNGKDRTVYLSGEGYFEVMKNPRQAFRVMIDDHTEIRDVGTHFNIMAFSDESIHAITLLEGAVNIKLGGQLISLKPGNQAQVTAASGTDQISIIRETDLAEVMAWKNNDFYFKDEDLQSIMRQVARWYNVEVVYAGDILQQRLSFGGKVSRSKNISAVLKIMESTNNVHFRIEGRRVTVMP